MKKYPRKYWTREKVLEEASKYTILKDFRVQSNKAYRVAIRFNMLAEIQNILVSVPHAEIKWTKEAIQEFLSSHKFSTRNELARKHSGVYQAIKRNKWDDLLKIISPEPLRAPKWTKETVLKEAIKYKTLKDFKKEQGRAYDVARELGILDELKQILPPSTSGRKKMWSKKAVKTLLDANSFESLNDLYEKFPGAHSSIYKNGWLDLLDVIPLKQTSWTVKKALEAVSKYETRQEALKNCGGAVSFLERHGYRHTLRDMFLTVGSAIKRAVYIIDNVEMKMVYVGLSYNPQKRLRAHIRDNKLQVLSTDYRMRVFTDFIPAIHAARIEDELIQYYTRQGWNVLNQRAGGGLGNVQGITTTRILQYE